MGWQMNFFLGRLIIRGYMLVFQGVYSFSHNHGSGKRLYLKGNYYRRDPFFTSMIMGGRVFVWGVGGFFPWPRKFHERNMGPRRKWDGDAYRVRASWLGWVICFTHPKGTSKGIGYHPSMWVFPKIMVPPNHPFVHRVFPYKPSIWGVFPLFLVQHPCNKNPKRFSNISRVDIYISRV